jgi:glycine oxidase
VAARSDIVVVGAGVVGCAVAYELARRGASVRLVDDRAPGMGATQAAAGVLAPFIEARHGGPLIDLTTRSLALFDTFIADVTAASGRRVTYRRTGTLDAAMLDASMQQFTAAAAMLHERGLQAELLDASAVRTEEPQLTDRVIGGLLIPSHGFVASTELTQALAAAARRHGAQVLPPARVRSIAVVGGNLTVYTNGETLSAGAVVLAAGTWASEVIIHGARDRVPVKPIRGQLLQFAWSGEPLRRVIWGERCYIVPWQDNTVLVGATVEDAGFDERTTVDGVRGLLDAACQLVPRAAQAGFTGARAGLRPATPDQLPVIGYSAAIPNLMYATGHYRNGVLLSPLTAQLVADAMLDNVLDPLLALTAPRRFGCL